MATLELTLLPVGFHGTSVSPYVAKAYDAVKDNEKIEVTLTSMGTILHGDVDDLFAAVRDMQEAVFDTGVQRVYSVIKLDDRRDKQASPEEKVQSVMDKVGK